MNNYIMLKDFLSKEECASILEASKRLELKPAKVRPSSEILPAVRASNVQFYSYYKEFPFLKSKLIQVFNEHVQVNGHEVNPDVDKFQLGKFVAQVK